ncbi:MAG TPA: TIGR03960 family B12-binding radical SAM protein [Candidatus Ozemobacteraceae bacterium]|nr:TIGR03960 family B12-binding radical SAM protein [Candidatus Ozemobacteraceae bacterium]
MTTGIPGISHWELLSVEKPSRYIGGEINQAPDKPGAALRACLAFPDVYELGMSNIALKILYERLNDLPDIACERVFSPWVDFEDLLRRKGLPLYSLETKRPLAAFDLLGITLPYEMTFTNVVNLLELGGIPVDRRDRTDGTFVIAGGPSASNPLPVADFFDAILIGDGEEAIVEVCELLREAKRQGIVRPKVLAAISELEGFWVPAFPRQVKRRVFKGFGASLPPQKPVVPHIEAVHSRAPLEIFRGCIQGCRFCNAGFFYRPKRERPVQALLECGQALLKNTGNESLGLVSLSTSDYTGLAELIGRLDQGKTYPDQTLSVPSLRMNDKTLAMLETVPELKKGGLTFAPEAGSQRLRDIINKNITEEEILRVVAATGESCYRVMKLYFMMGLPFETEADLDAIAELVEKIETTARREKIRKDINISLSGFVPKPFTPFQWAAQDDMATLDGKRRRICTTLKKSRARVSWRDAYLCQLEGVLARGDERIGALLKAARKRGCRFDGWSEHFRPDAWREAFAEVGIDPATYTRERPLNEMLPWEFIDYRTPREYFVREYREAARLAGVTLP